MEQWIRATYTGSYGAVHAEWSKEWANTPAGAWTDTAVMGSDIPDSYRAGQAADDGWDAAVATLDVLDPARVFSSAFLDGLLR